MTLSQQRMSTPRVAGGLPVNYREKPGSGMRPGIHSIYEQRRKLLSTPTHWPTAMLFQSAQSCQKTSVSSRTACSFPLTESWRMCTRTGVERLVVIQWVPIRRGVRDRYLGGVSSILPSRPIKSSQSRMLPTVPPMGECQIFCHCSTLVTLCTDLLEPRLPRHVPLNTLLRPTLVWHVYSQYHNGAGTIDWKAWGRVVESHESSETRSIWD